MDTGHGKMTMEAAVVAKDTVDGQDGYWIETKVTPPNMPSGMVSKMFYYGDEDVVVITHHIIEMPGWHPMEFPDNMPGMQQSQSQTIDARKDTQYLGSDSVTIPAGTFACEHYRTRDAEYDLWVKEKTGPWGLVKSARKNGNTMVLTQVLSEVKPKITEKPAPFNPMGMARPQQP